MHTPLIVTGCTRVQGTNSRTIPIPVLVLLGTYPPLRIVRGRMHTRVQGTNARTNPTSKVITVVTTAVAHQRVKPLRACAKSLSLPSLK